MWLVAYLEFSTTGFVFCISSLKVIDPSNLKVLQSETRLHRETDENFFKNLIKYDSCLN